MAAGTTIKFSGKGTAGNLLDPHNWVGGVVPGTADTARITMNVGGPVGGIFSVNNLMLLGTEQILFTGTVDTAGVGNCTGLMVCDGAVAAFAPGAVLNDGNVLIVGNDAVGTVLATGTASAHSVLNTVSGNIGKLAEGVGTVMIADAVWHNSGRVAIGDEGIGTLGVTANGVVTVGGDLDMGDNTGASGTLMISGGTVMVAGSLRAGGGAASGVASIGVGVGGTLGVATNFVVGAGSAVALGGGAIAVGATGTTGHLSIMGGGLIAGTGTLGSPDGVAIEDDGIIRAAGGMLAVGDDIDGTGALQIEAGSTAVVTGSSLKLASIAFIGPGATLALASDAKVTSVLAGFSVGDAIAMAGVDAVSFKVSTGILTLSDNHAVVDTLHFYGGNFTGETFSVHQAGGMGIITLQG